MPRFHNFDLSLRRPYGISAGKIQQGCMGWRAKTCQYKGRLNLMLKRLRLITHEQNLLYSHSATIFFLWDPTLNGKGKSTGLCVL